MKLWKVEKVAVAGIPGARAEIGAERSNGATYVAGSDGGERLAGALPAAALAIPAGDRASDGQ